ncbi:MAG: hypothetical protein ABIP48_08410 [Planctomycetota bacterium]
MIVAERIVVFVVAGAAVVLLVSFPVVSPVSVSETSFFPVNLGV